MNSKNLNHHIKEMKGMAEMLVPFTFPQASILDEQEVLLLKQRNITVDGHDLFLCYSKADYDQYFLESLQIQSYYTPFLPFAVVCKLGRAFLGHNNLSYVEFIKNSKKIYCWTLRSRDGRSLLPDQITKSGSYEGFQFSILQPGSVDLF
jgi:hypothetical protein